MYNIILYDTRMLFEFRSLQCEFIYVQLNVLKRTSGIKIKKAQQRQQHASNYTTYPFFVVVAGKYLHFIY